MSPDPVRRMAEIEEPSNLYLIHPVAARLVPLFARLGVTPNMVSLAGMACGVAAGFSYFHYRDGRFVLLGFLLMVLWHVMDGADGQLARLTNAQSELGKVLDGICDYVTFIAVYVALALAMGGGWLWVPVVVAGCCHAVQSAAYEAQRQAYGYWGWGKGMPAPVVAGHGAHGVFVLLDRAYTGVQARLAPVPHGLSDALAGATAHDAGRARYRAVFAPDLRRWSILSANYRTLGIFIAALLKAPLWYFGFEIFGFSLILAVLLVAQQARYRRFAMD